LKAFLRLVCQILFRVKPLQYSDQFQASRLLIVANHESFIDGLLLGLFLPVDPVFVVHTAIAQNRWFKIILRMVDYLAVDPTSPLAMKKVIKLIEAGRPVMIFPEGRITVTGSLMKVYDGPAFVAARTGAAVLPVRIDGASRSYFSRTSGKYPHSLFPQISISVLPQAYLKISDSGTARMRRRTAGEGMRKIMQDMLFHSQPKQTLFLAMLDTMEIYGRKHRFLEDMKQIEHSYGDILKMALALGRITTKFAAEGERVGILLPNLAATLGLVVGMSAFRRVPAMLNYTAGANGMQDACTAAVIRTIVTSRQFIETARIGAQVDSLKNVNIVYLEDLKSLLDTWDKLWLLAYAMRFPRLVNQSQDSLEPAVVLFTSGSEGKPKGVVHSHLSLLSNIAQIRSVIDFSVDDKFLNALPIFHSFGLTAGALLPLLTGTKLFLYPSPLHYRVIPEVIYDRGCSVLFGTSTFLANYARFAHPYDFYRLRYVIAGAEKLSDTVRSSWFEKFGIRILEGYGATETAPVIAVNTPMAYRTGTVGVALPGIQKRLIPVPGIPTGGQLHVKGPNVMLGYYRFERPGVIEAPVSEVGEGWYDTGDIVEVDDDGFISIKGRVKRFAKIAGEMISLEVVEKIALCASPNFQHTASTRPDSQKGEAVILFTTDTLLVRERLQAAAQELGLPELAVARKIISVTALPLLGTGKIDYLTLKQMAEEITADSGPQPESQMPDVKPDSIAVVAESAIKPDMTTHLFEKRVSV
jgi:acyl-[acyl-carrier-protein]-phospholipid O-acyltransferase/long-chain-fatty-acid--[acyl-carrier-protein] ligase